MAVEVFGNIPVTTVTSGGTTAPAGGTVETWAVASSASFPAVSASATPPTQIHVGDVALNSEIILVTNISGTTWTVTRGAEGTTPVAHGTGFTVYQVVSAGAYAQLRDTDWLNVVTQFGADPTGVADSTTAIQAALDAVPANGGTVYIPAGVFKCNAATLNPVVNGTIIAGGGWGSQLKFDGTLVSPLIGMADTTQRRVFIRDLRITQAHASNSGTAISCNYFVDSSLERLLIDGSTNPPNIGVSFNVLGSYYNVVRDCRINAAGSSGACVYFDTNSNSNVVDNCRLIGDSSTTGVHANANGLLISHADMEGTGLCGVAVGAAGVNVTLINPYLQGLTTAITLASGCGPVSVIGGDADGATTGISDSGCNALSVIGFRNQAGTLQSYFTGGANATLGLGPVGGAPDAFIWRTAANEPRVSSFAVTNSSRVGGLLIIDNTLSTLGSGASQGVEIQNAITPPGTTPTGGGVLYAASGALHWKGSSGTDTTIAPA